MSEAVKVKSQTKFVSLLFYVSLITLVYWVCETFFIPFGFPIVNLLFQGLYYPIWIITVVLPFAILIGGILRGFRNWHLILAVVFCVAMIIVLFYRGQPTYD